MPTWPSLPESAAPGTHGFGRHNVPGPWNAPLCESHIAGVAIMQNEPLVPGAFTQHAPTLPPGGPQGEGAQVDPAPLNVPPIALHRISVTTTQWAFPLTQHAPVAGGAPHVVLAHGVPAP